jgi:formate dehydrogenase maturation protein FdhE
MNKTRGPKTSCTTCGSTDTLAVAISMEDGGVRFWTCAACETTGWERGGSAIRRDAALAHIPRR